MDDKKVKQDKQYPQHISKSAKTLLKIVHGDVKDIKVSFKSIITGKKLKNSVLVNFIREFQRTGQLTDSQLIEVIIVLDDVIEKEHLSAETLEAIRKDPSILNKI